MIDHFATWPTLPFVVIDVETTGVDPEKDRIVEIGFARFEEGKLVRSLGSFIQPGAPIPAEATAVHGITDDQVAEAPLLDPFVHTIEVLDLCRHAIPVAYNAAFDRAFLMAAFGSPKPRMWAEEVAFATLPIFSFPGWFDPLVRIREVDRFVKGKGRHKLETTCRRHGVPIGRAHRAEDDAIATGRLWAKLTADMNGRGLANMTVGGMLRDQQIKAAEQERNFQAWLAKQPPREGA